MSVISGSTLFDEIGISINSEKKQEGYIENFVINLNEPINRVRKFYIENVQLPNSDYFFHAGNNRLQFLHRLLYSAITITLRPGVYTGNELATEINKRISEESFNIIFTSVYDGIFIYNDTTNKFEFSEIPEVIVLENENEYISPQTKFGNAVVNTVSFSGGNILSPLSQVIGFRGEFNGFFGVIEGTGSLHLTEDGDDKFASTASKYLDPDNPGQQKFVSSFEAYGPFTVSTGNQLFWFNQNQNISTGVNLSAIGKNGFEVAADLEANMDAAGLSGFRVRYNVIDFTFNISNNSIGFGLRHNTLVPLGFVRDISFLNIEGNNIYYGNVEVRGPEPAHTVSLNVTDTLRINEGGSDIETIIPPGTYTVTVLATIVQTAIDNNTNLINNYVVSFSAITGKFIFKVIKNGTIFPIYSIKYVGDAKDAAIILGFSSSSDNLSIHRSDIRQYEILPDITVTNLRVYIKVSFLIPIGTYTINELVSTIDTAIPLMTGILNTYDFTYDGIDKRFSLQITNGTASGVRYGFDNNTESYITGANTSLGFSRLNQQRQTSTNPVKGNDLSILIEDTYFYIKSNILTSNILSNISADISYQNVIYKVIKNSPVDLLTFTERNNRKITLANNSKFDKIDFRLEDENGNIVQLNGQHWSFTLVIERY